MPPRLSELYQPGDEVEICFDSDDPVWLAARVIGPQTPGLWVQTKDQRLWFVTNGRRIRTAGWAEKGEQC